MPTKIFANLPVKDLPRSTEFFTKLGFSIDKHYTDGKAGCVVISDDIYAMLLTEEVFQTFTTKELADARRRTTAIAALEVDSRQRVAELAHRALESCSAPAGE